MAHRVADANRPTPVLHHQSDIPKIQRVDERCQIAHMGAERVFPVGRGFAFAETHMVGNHNPMRCRQRWDKISIYVAPGWLSVQQ